MSISGKFCLKWNDFQANVSSAFGSLREERDFADVTLACEDGRQVEAHKVILASSSPFFNTVLKRNNHQHPLIYMRGLKYEDLVAILDFLYHGEANIYQDNLDSFLAIAEELKLKGLAGSESEKEETAREPTKKLDTNNKTYGVKKEDNAYINNQDYKTIIENVEEVNTVALMESKVSVSEIQELDEKVKSMMKKGDKMCTGSKSNLKVTICTVCGKEGQWTIIRNHIEANHIEGMSHPCNICGKTYRSRNALAHHKSLHHRN